MVFRNEWKPLLCRVGLFVQTKSSSTVIFCKTQYMYIAQNTIFKIPPKRSKHRISQNEHAMLSSDIYIYDVLLFLS